MVIVHIAPSAPYNEGWGYQDNLLPKHHKLLGHDVTLIITSQTHKDGRIVEGSCKDYVNKDGVRVIRKKIQCVNLPVINILTSKLDVYDDLIEINPDFVFYHGLLTSTIFQVTKYKKRINPKLYVVQDNHLDWNIGMVHKKSIKYSIVRMILRWIYHVNDKTISKVYGVTPWRRDYAIKVFDVPAEKADVLIMGADDEKIDLNNKQYLRNLVRRKYDIKEKDFLIVTGGKLDKKKKINVLLKAVSNIENVKLILFGELLDDVRDELSELINDNENITYVGWISSQDVYKFFFAADLVCFPGQHSVLWEQACACKVPCLFAKWEGMDHVNNGGNSDFLEIIDEETIRNNIEDLKYTEKYFNLKTIANSDKTDIYLYSQIAKKTIDDMKK